MRLNYSLSPRSCVPLKSSDQYTGHWNTMWNTMATGTHSTVCLEELIAMLIRLPLEASLELESFELASRRRPRVAREAVLEDKESDSNQPG